MRLLRTFLAAVVTAVYVSACGGGGSGGDGVGASDGPNAEHANAERVVRKWVDEDDC